MTFLGLQWEVANALGLGLLRGAFQMRTVENDLVSMRSGTKNLIGTVRAAATWFMGARMCAASVALIAVRAPQQKVIPTRGKRMLQHSASIHSSCQDRSIQTVAHVIFGRKSYMDDSFLGHLRASNNSGCNSKRCNLRTMYVDLSRKRCCACCLSVSCVICCHIFD